MGRGGAFATPDDQGPYDTSTQHALAKAICDGCINGYFVENQSIDLDQSDVTNALLHESGIYERTHRHSKYKKRNFLEWVSIHYTPNQPETATKKLKQETYQHSGFQKKP